MGPLSNKCFEKIFMAYFHLCLWCHLLHVHLITVNCCSTKFLLLVPSSVVVRTAMVLCGHSHPPSPALFLLQHGNCPHGARIPHPLPPGEKGSAGEHPLPHFLSLVLMTPSPSYKGNHTGSGLSHRAQCCPSSSTV